MINIMQSPDTASFSKVITIIKLINLNGSNSVYLTKVRGGKKVNNRKSYLVLQDPSFD